MNKKEKNNQDSYINKYLIDSFNKLGKPQADLVIELGKSQPYVSALVNGKKKVGKEVAKQLHELYGFDEGLILTGEYKKSTDEQFKEQNTFENLPINKQLEILHKENKALKREIDRMSIMMEISFSTLMAHFDIDSPEEKHKENEPKPKSKAN